MDTRASRCAIWTLHAPPSREADINPNPKKGGYPAPHRVTFLTGPNRDFPKWRRHTGSLANERGRAKTASGAPRVNLFSRPYARARALLARPWSARCYGVARQREGSRQNSIGGSGVLSLRHFGLVLFIPWRVGAEEAGAAKAAIMAYGFG